MVDGVFQAVGRRFCTSGEPMQEKMRASGEIFRDPRGYFACLLVCFLLKVRLYGTPVRGASGSGWFAHWCSCLAR